MQDEFVARANELGAQVHCVGTGDLAVEKVVDIFRSFGSKKVAVSHDLGALRANLVDALQMGGAEFVDGVSADIMALADMGVTCAALGVAETGSIVIAGDAVTRLSSTLPLVHVAILDASAMVPSLDEAGEWLRRASTASADDRVRFATFVSGPSRTSDVEKTLTVGVHGPGRLHIILLS